MSASLEAAHSAGNVFAARLSLRAPPRPSSRSGTIAAGARKGRRHTALEIVTQIHGELLANRDAISSAASAPRVQSQTAFKQRELESILSQMSALRVLRDVERTELAQFYAHCNYTIYEPLDTVIAEGVTEDWAIFLLQGAVEVHISSKKRLGIKAPDFVGENGMFVPGAVRSATVVATCRTEALTLSRSRFFKLYDFFAGSPVQTQLEKMMLKSAGCNSIDAFRAQHDAFTADPAAYLATLASSSKRKSRKSKVDTSAAARAAAAASRAEAEIAAAASAAALASRRTERALALGFAAGLVASQRSAAHARPPTPASWGAGAAALDDSLAPHAAVDALLLALFPEGTGQDDVIQPLAGITPRLERTCARLAQLESQTQRACTHISGQRVEHSAASSATEASTVASAAALAAAQAELTRLRVESEALAARLDVATSATAEVVATLDATRSTASSESAALVEELASARDAAASGNAALAAALAKVAIDEATAVARAVTAKDDVARLEKELVVERRARAALQNADVVHNDDLEAALRKANVKARRAELANVSLRRGLGELSHALAEERTFGAQLTQRVEELVGQIATHQEIEGREEDEGGSNVCPPAAAPEAGHSPPRELPRADAGEVLLNEYVARYDDELMAWLQEKMDMFDEREAFRASRLKKFGSRELFEGHLCSAVAVRLRQARSDFIAAGAVPQVGDY